MYIILSGLTLSAILGLLIVTLFAILFLRQRNQAKMPPGPAWIPLVGNISELNSDPDLRISLRRLQKKYGNIYKLYLGPCPTIIVCGYEAIREIFIKRGVEFSDRPAAMLGAIILNGAKGITAVSGDTWKNQRKFTLLTLRNFGFGKSTLQDKIHTEIKFFLSEIEKVNHKPFQMMVPIQTSVGNIISHLVFGGHFNHADARFKTLMDGFNSFIQFASVRSPVIFWPILRFVPGDFFGVKTISRKMQEVKDFVNELIEEHLKKFDEEKIEDFIDAFISEMKKEDDREKTNIFTRDYLAAIVMDLFIAGTETTSTTITWASFYLATRPEVQNRIFDEIKTNVGMERLPSMQDKECLVYTEAFIMEVLRMSSISILSIPHAPVTDVFIRGYHIPKSMRMLPDIHSVLSDPKVWGDPENFRPERFVSEEGKLLKPNEFIPFFTGRRNCLGESLAKMELLLFLSALVQRFELMPSQGEILDIRDVDGIFGLTHAPKPFNIRAIPRHDKA
ncbi:hypothetical protein CHS0354_026609 [Potamilus streckersoni]|uniref:Cytochrome P450 n=1 Tax=Potamilus streckersoni TaxID=2493646 RepID=A0AAE0SU01_9BIVA|nr:hypothetical protein CHS0354_026609 [Potamilus streckersoni]